MVEVTAPGIVIGDADRIEMKVVGRWGLNSARRDLLLYTPHQGETYCGSAVTECASDYQIGMQGGVDSASDPFLLHICVSCNMFPLVCMDTEVIEINPLASFPWQSNFGSVSSKQITEAGAEVAFKY